MITKTLLGMTAFCAFAASSWSQFFPQDQITWRTYKQGAFSSARSFATNVLETEGQFQRFWANMIGDMGGKMPTTGVDWAREKLVAINLGPRPNSGYELFVQNVKRERSAEIVVQYRERLPIQGVNYAQVQTSPWIIVKMQREAGRIIFRGETVKGTIVPGGTVIFPPNQGGGSCCGDRCRCCSSCGCGCQRGGRK